MGKVVNIVDIINRSSLKFGITARKAFAFLADLGFGEVESNPTLVRYRKEDIEVDVYHGRQSYEVGAGITAFGTRYSLGEIIRAINPEAAKQFRYVTAITPEVVETALEHLSVLMELYGSAALRGDSQFISVLEEQQKIWTEEYALDVLAEQLQPQADEAFRRKDYSTATMLYSRIRQCLSPAALVKLRFAEKHRKD